ncbi:helix-turn-helix transcriptional regulator [Paenibacillus sp. FSL W8-0194]|uniref:helix-turn-helix domain-containing protein n=1 Tax=Paenibacillus sp. FSL W8-0194 TaxID=2921711 RepID=UPI0030DCBE4F
MSVVGDRIKNLRELAGLTQLDLANRIGINNSVLSRIEAGKRSVEDHEMNKFADFFDVDTDYLLGRTITKKKNQSTENNQGENVFRGDRVALWRKKRNLTQEELGKLVNVTKVSISGYESGNRSPDTETLQKLAEVFNVSTDYLLGRTDNPNSPDSDGSGSPDIKDIKIQRKMEFFKKLENDLGLDLSDPEVQKKLKRAAKIIFSEED